MEDEDSLRSLTREVLVASHYTVLEAVDGSQALEIARQYTGPIHPLLTDVVMPKPNGPSLAKELVIRHPDMKVIFMSGYISDSAIVAGLASSEAQLIQKPFTQETITRKIREVLGVHSVR